MIPYIDLRAQYESLKPEIDHAMRRVMSSGRYTRGEELEEFEENMAEYLGCKHVIGVGNGYDALFLSLKVIGVGVGRTVLTDTYTHISTHAAIVNNGATVLFDPDYVDHVTAAYIPVHMNGRVNLTKRTAPYQPEIIEDACQALGSSYMGQKAGTLGLLGCFSCHPFKVLSCAGDGGFISTNSDHHAAELRRLRNHGEDRGYGVNSRLDPLQAAILNVKLPYLDGWIKKRREIAQRYDDGLPGIRKPPPPSEGPFFDTYSSYVIGGSPELLKHMNDSGVECFSHIRTDCVSLPIYPEMTNEQIETVIDTVCRFF